MSKQSREADNVAVYARFRPARTEQAKITIEKNEKGLTGKKTNNQILGEKCQKSPLNPSK